MKSTQAEEPYPAEANFRHPTRLDAGCVEHCEAH